jgi:hypothetical protein
VLRFRSPAVVIVLALFIASVVASSLAPLASGGHASGHDDAVLALAGPPGAGGDEAPDSDGMKCNHGCHFLQHFQGSIDRASAFVLEQWAVAYAAVEPTTAPQLFFDPRFRPPRVPARSA